MADAAASAFGPREVLVQPGGSRPGARADRHRLGSGRDQRRLPAEPRSAFPTWRRGSCSARWRRRVSQGAIPDTVHAARASARDHARAAHRGRASCTFRREPRSRSSRPTAAASRRTTGPASSSATRSSTSTRHGQDVKRYCRDLEEALIRTLAAVRRRGDADRGADRDLGARRAGAAEDRLDRRPHHEAG